MNTRALTAVSLLANVGLVVLVMRTGRTGAATGEDSAVLAIRSAAEVSRVKTNLTRVELTVTNEAPPFHWSDVQAEDLQVYAANLRGIGCPAETVRDVIEGEVNEWFLARRRALLEPLHRGYWDLAASGKDLDGVTKPFEAALEKMDEDREARIKESLGVVTERKDRPERKARPDYLSEATQSALEDLQKKFTEEFRKVRPGKGGKWTPELHAKRVELEARRKAAIRALMTPEEYAEHELRSSSHARTAQSAVGFEATPEEARAAARIYQRFEGPEAQVEPKDPDAAAKKAQAAEAKRQREEAMKQALGEDRYAQFQEGLNSRFQEIHAITRRYELPREIASQAAAILKTRDEALQRMRTDKGMNAEERSARAMAMQAELRAALLQTMGERALRTYEKYHGPVIPAEKPNEQ